MVVRLTRGERALARVMLACLRVLGYAVRRGKDPYSPSCARLYELLQGRPRPNLSPELAEIGARYDRGAVVFEARHRGQPVGVMTLYAPSEGHSRTLDALGARLPDAITLDGVLDAGRLIVHPDYRRGASLAFLVLLLNAQVYSRDHGRRYWIAASSPALVRLLREIAPSTTRLERNPAHVLDEQLARYWHAYRAGRRPPTRALLYDLVDSPPSTMLRAAVRRALESGRLQP